MNKALGSSKNLVTSSSLARIGVDKIKSARGFLCSICLPICPFTWGPSYLYLLAMKIMDFCSKRMTIRLRLE